MSISNSSITNNAAGAWYTRWISDLKNLLLTLSQSTTRLHSLPLGWSAGGNGGGVSISIPSDNQLSDQQNCSLNRYWQFNHWATVLVQDTVIIGNSAGSGGGFYAGPGGEIMFSNVIVQGNTATRFGGGLALGGGMGASTCSFTAVGMSFDSNVAQHGGSQLNMACTADLVIESSVLTLNTVSSQVRDFLFLVCVI